MKRHLVLVTAVLTLAAFMATGCGGGPHISYNADISGKYVYQGAPAGQSPVLDFKSDGTVMISVPAQVDPTTKQQTQAQNLTWYFKTGPELLKMWRDKNAVTSTVPTTFLLVYKGTLVDSQGQVLVKEGAAASVAPSSSTPSSTP